MSPDIVTIDDTNLPMPMETMKMKSASLHWEFMFARAMHKTPDMIEQHKLLSWVAGEIDSGNFRTTVDQMLSDRAAEGFRSLSVHERWNQLEHTLASHGCPRILGVRVV